MVAVLCIAFTLYALPSGISRITADEFFLMGRSAAIKQYNDTTVAYSLQVAVTVYFFFWGFQYGLSNLFFIATWFLGLFVFGLFAKRLYRAIQIPSFDGSMFTFFALDKPWLRRFMAFLVIVSLVGLLFTELYLTAQFVGNVAKARNASGGDSHVYFWLSFAFLSFVVLWYCSLGGMRKVVITDTWQLSISYIGSATFIAALSRSINEHLGSYAMSFVCLGMSGIFLAMAVLPKIVSRFILRRRSRSTTSYTTLVALLASAIICLIPVLRLPIMPAQLIVFPKPIGSMFMDPWGWAPIVGFTIINLVWQFSDYTAYHRLALLGTPDNEEEAVDRVKESILVTMFNSPLTWGLGIFAGMAVYASGIVPDSSADVFGDFVSNAARIANTGDVGMRAALVGLAAFLTAAMLSTVDSGFMSVALILVRDVSGRSLAPLGRFAANLSVILVMTLFAMLLVEMKVDILVFLNATYSWALIFFGITFAYLCGKHISSGWIVLSLTSGAAVGAWSTFNPLHLPDLVSLVFPSVAAIALSSFVALVAPRRKVDGDTGRDTGAEVDDSGAVEGQ